MPTEITQTVDLPVDAERAYRTIADGAEHSAFTGAPAVMPSEPGGAFSTHGGAIEGRVLELVPGTRIVQAWRPADWPDGTYSIVRYDFADLPDGSRLTLTHSGLPEDGAEHIAEGWQERYWGPLARHLA